MRKKESIEQVIAEMKTETVFRKPLEEVMSDFATRVEESLERKIVEVKRKCLKQAHLPKFTVGDFVWVVNKESSTVHKEKIVGCFIHTLLDEKENKAKTAEGYLYNEGGNTSQIKYAEELFKTKSAAQAFLKKTSNNNKRKINMSESEAEKPKPKRYESKAIAYCVDCQKIFRPRRNAAKCPECEAKYKAKYEKTSYCKRHDIPRKRLVERSHSYCERYCVLP